MKQNLATAAGLLVAVIVGYLLFPTYTSIMASMWDSAREITEAGGVLYGFWAGQLVFTLLYFGGCFLVAVIV